MKKVSIPCSPGNLIKLCEYFEVDISYFTLPLIRHNLTFKQKRREYDYNNNRAWPQDRV